MAFIITLFVFSVMNLYIPGEGVIPDDLPRFVFFLFVSLYILV